MELYIFARFHSHEGLEDTVYAALQSQVAATRIEPGCLGIHAFRSTRDPRLFFIHSCWTDEAAFDVHAELADTKAFVERMQTLIDHPFDVTRTLAIV
jgi:quinol monooxygenase YgiN